MEDMGNSQAPPPRRMSGRERTQKQPRTQIAKQNRSAEEARKDLARQYFIRLAFEHAIWQREVSLKGLAGGSESDTKCSPEPPTYEKEAPFQIL